MSNEKKSGFDKAPGPDTFSFDAYIQGKSTFPEFSHTVYLDQAAGAELGTAIQDYETGVNVLRALRLQQERAMESGSMSMADDTLADLAEKIDEQEKEIERLDLAMAELTEKIKSTSITLSFQASTPQKYGKVIRQAEKAYAKAHGRIDEKDMEHVTGRTRTLLAHQLAAYCTGWETPEEKEENDRLEAVAKDRGEKFKRSLREAPSQESFDAMLDSLISSEMLRLLTALNAGLDANAEWASRIDAGFPGGGADMGSEPVGDSGAEDGEIVGDSAA